MGSPVEYTFDITVKENAAPQKASAYTDIPDVLEGHAIDYDQAISSLFADAEGDEVHTKVAFAPDPAWLTYDEATNKISGTPPLGTHPLSITATLHVWNDFFPVSDQSNEYTFDVVFNVLKNLPVQIESTIPDFVASSSGTSTLDLSVYCTDPESQEIVYSLTENGSDP